MKIQLTMAEAIEKLRFMFKPTMGEDVEIEILKANGLTTILKRAVEGLRYNSDQKIMAIKALRQAVADDKGFMGLADAKYAVENWASFLAFVEQNGRLPQNGFADNTMK
jgi:hypothetical protein